MKFILPGIILLSLFSLPAQASQQPEPYDDTLFLKRDLSQVSIKEIQQLTGKKFTLKQKIAFKIVQKKTRRFKKTAEGDQQANLSFIFALLLVGIGVLALFNVVMAGFLSIFLLIAFPLLGILAFWLGLRSIKKNGKNFKNLFGTIIGAAAIIATIIVGIGALTMF